MTESAYWRCFHCGEKFANNMMGKLSAQQHFGRREDDAPICYPLAEYIRELNDTLARYRDDDSKIAQAMTAMKSVHATRLRLAEERGYAKSIGDIKTLLVPMVVSEEQWDRSINGRKDTENVERHENDKKGT